MSLRDISFLSRTAGERGAGNGAASFFSRETDPYLLSRERIIGYIEKIGFFSSRKGSPQSRDSIPVYRHLLLDRQWKVKKEEEEEEKKLDRKRKKKKKREKEEEGRLVK